MDKTDIYLVPYQSQPRERFEGCSSHFVVVTRAIAASEWPYDNGDDPSFFAVRKHGGLLSWGVCREDLRTAIRPGSIVA